jgi:hypothetical protein
MRMAQGARGMAHGTQRKDKRVRFEAGAKIKQAYSGCQKFVPIICHCEEPSDKAIFWKT